MESKLAIQEKTFEAIAQKSPHQDEELPNIQNIEYGDIATLRQNIYQGMINHKQSKKKTSQRYFTLFVYFLEVLWVQVMPKSLIPNHQILGNDLLESIKQPNLNILIGTYDNLMKIFKQENKLFCILVYKSNIFKRQHKMILRLIDTLNIMPLHTSNQHILRKLGITDVYTDEPLIIFCKFNKIDELVVFAEIELNMPGESFEEIFKQIQQEVRQYQQIQIEVQTMIENENAEN